MASLLLLFSKNDFKCVMNRQRDNSLISQCLWETLMDYKGNMFVILVVHEFPSRYSISCPSHLIPSHNLFWCFHQVYKIKSIIVLVCKAPKYFWSTTATLRTLFLYSSKPREVRNFSRSSRKNRWEPVYSSGASAMSEWRNYPLHTKGSHTWFEKTNGVAVNSVGDWLATIATPRLHSCTEFPKLICCLIRSRDRKESLTCQSCAYVRTGYLK